jgi:peptidyl-tRNA hydrolase, PTH1 family
MTHILIIGLGNPGSEYKNTRHNIGFDAIDIIAEHFSFPSFSDKFSSLVSSKIIGSNKITLLKPQTYMNLSGQAVSQVIHFYKIDLEDVIVIHDDLDLQLAQVKMKIAGGSGGHNGIKSIDQHLGLNYYRIRLGIGRPNTQQDVSNFVLNRFSQEESNLMNNSIDSLLDNFELILSKDSASLINKLSMDNKDHVS